MATNHSGKSWSGAGPTGPGEGFRMYARNGSRKAENASRIRFTTVLPEGRAKYCMQSVCASSHAPDRISSSSLATTLVGVSANIRSGRAA
jgi:hypothetical protein